MPKLAVGADGFDPALPGRGAPGRQASKAASLCPGLLCGLHRASFDVRQCLHYARANRSPEAALYPPGRIIRKSRQFATSSTNPQLLQPLSLPKRQRLGDYGCQPCKSICGK